MFDKMPRDQSRAACEAEKPNSICISPQSFYLLVVYSPLPARCVIQGTMRASDFICGPPYADVHCAMKVHFAGKRASRQETHASGD